MASRNGSRNTSIRSRKAILNLKIISAHNLTKKDIFGASDPYVAIYLEPRSRTGPTVYEYENIVGRTKTVKKSLNPEWNELFQLEVDISCQTVILDVFDENRGTRDDFLGRVFIANTGYIHPEEGLQCLTLQKRSPRSNVSGELKFSCDWNFPMSYEASSRINISSFGCFSNMSIDDINLFTSVESDYSLTPMLDKLAGHPYQDKLKIALSEDVTEVTYYPQRNELNLPNHFSLTYMKMAKDLLQFFFKDQNVIPESNTQWNSSLSWRQFLRKISADPALLYCFKNKVSIFENSELMKIDFRMTHSSKIIFIPRYKTLIVPIPNGIDSEEIFRYVTVRIRRWAMDGNQQTIRILTMMFLLQVLNNCQYTGKNSERMDPSFLKIGNGDGIRMEELCIMIIQTE